jgi:hypothetical protein
MSNEPRKLNLTQTFYSQADDLGGLSPQQVLDTRDLLVHASFSGDYETYITQEPCEEHGTHVCVVVTHRFTTSTHDIPGVFTMVFGSLEEMLSCLPLDLSGFKRMPLELVMVAYEEKQVQKQAAMADQALKHAQNRRQPRIITPEEYRRHSNRNRRS